TRPIGEGRVKCPRAGDGCVRVEAQAVALDDPRIALPGQELHRDPQRAVEQPPRCRRANEDRGVRAGRADGIDDLDLPRRVPEPVAGDVEADRAHPRTLTPTAAAPRGGRRRALALERTSFPAAPRPAVPPGPTR